MLNSAKIIGRVHRLHQQSCQDMAITGEPVPGTVFGLVLDGCGSKFRDGTGTYPSHNEVGAKLLGQFVAAYLRQRLACVDRQRNEPSPWLHSLLTDLNRASLIYLQELLRLIPLAALTERTRFVATHLLCTVVGFVVTPDAAAFFWSGDGHLLVNGEVHGLESNNQPDYLAIQLLTGDLSLPKEETRFQVREIAPPSELRWLAVATDGWDPELLAELERPRPGLNLQRWLNVQARNRGIFDDDAAVSVWHQTVT